MTVRLRTIGSSSWSTVCTVTIPERLEVLVLAATVRFTHAFLSPSPSSIAPMVIQSTSE